MMSAILLSGGMDSAALAWWRRPDIALTIDYGQVSARGEIRAATAIARELGIAHEILTVDCHQLGSGDLAGTAPSGVAPVPEWWPFRNQLLITIAGMRGIALGVSELLVGAVASDGRHADGRPAFFEGIDTLMLSQEGGMRVLAPAIGMVSVDLIRTSGIELPILAWTHSCHTGDLACGNCRGCFKHQSVMGELGYIPF
jgi:7-cyano-7-deazaguanine synthase